MQAQRKGLPEPLVSHQHKISYNDSDEEGKTIEQVTRDIANLTKSLNPGKQMSNPKGNASVGSSRK